MTEVLLERLSPLGADAKSLRREVKRALVEDVTVKQESPESPPKKQHMPDKPKASKSAKSGGSAAGGKKKATARHHEVAELQGVVDGIQQQVDAASRGIQELKQLVNTHLMGGAPAADASESWLDGCDDVDMITCVSPPASLMAMDQEDDDEAKQDDATEFTVFPVYQQQALTFYGSEPMPFSC